VKLVHDWDAHAPLAGRLEFDDETLRDGLQSPSVRRPSLEEALAFLRLLPALGVTAADVGLPGAGARAKAHIEVLCREILASDLGILPNCAARTVPADVQAVLDIMQHIGTPVEIAMFVASSPIRCHVEGWDLDMVLRRAADCVGFAVGHGAPVTFVAEDSTRTRPADLRRLLQAAVRAGANRVCVADTAGQATPMSALAIVRFAAETLAQAGAAGVGIDWHGHNDRGLAVANALAGAMGGATRLHGTALGVGERVGNAPMEELLVNARLLGWAAPDLSRVMDYAELAARMLGVAIPTNAPVVGRDAFRTSTGVHAAAIAKAAAAGELELVDLVYSAVPASWLNREQVVEVGPMSGASNVRLWLHRHGYGTSPELVSRILARAKRADRTLTDDELHILATAKGSHDGSS
jgi:2-isopropylmalate synthase